MVMCFLPLATLTSSACTCYRALHWWPKARQTRFTVSHQPLFRFSWVVIIHYSLLANTTLGKSTVLWLIKVCMSML